MKVVWGYAWRWTVAIVAFWAVIELANWSWWA